MVKETFNLMKSFRVVDDGDRLYIVIDHPEKSDVEAAVQFAASRMGITDNSEKAEKPRKLQPVTAENPEIPERVKEAKNLLTEKEEIIIPYIGDMKVFKEWWNKKDTLDEKTKSEVVSKCGMYIRSTMRKIDSEDEEEIKRFLVNYEDIFTDASNRIIKQNGCKSMKVFTDTAAKDNIAAAFSAYKNQLNKLFPYIKSR